MCISKSNKGIEERLVNCSSSGAPDVALLSALEPQQRCTLPFGCTVPFLFLLGSNSLTGGALRLAKAEERKPEPAN